MTNQGDVFADLWFSLDKAISTGKIDEDKLWAILMKAGAEQETLAKVLRVFHHLRKTAEEALTRRGSNWIGDGLPAYHNGLVKVCNMITVIQNLH